MSSQVQVINIQPFGAGGHGDLYVGQLSHNGLHVVVKYLREAHLPHERNAFMREVSILSRGLKGLVRLFGADTKAARPYYVMEYLAGGPLTRCAGRLSHEQILAVATELAQTLANFHSTAGAHGDFKPDNILLSHDGHMKLADPLGNGFGLSVLFAQNRGGTPGYWAPEVRAGGTISRSGDVYSYAATMYHLQTGIRPQDGQFLDLGTLGYLCLPTIHDVIAACSQPQPKARPTMLEVLQMLRGVKWADIQAQRKRAQDALTLAALVGGLLLLFGISGE